MPGIRRVNGRERKHGRKKRQKRRKKTVVRNMLDRGYEIEDICVIAGCEASFVEEVKKELFLQ